MVRPSEQEREELTDLISSGKRAARTIVKARILLKADVSDAGASLEWASLK